MESQADFINKVAELIHRLPPMPVSIERILQAANDPNENDASLLELIRQDPGLCANLLHLANTFSCSPGGHDETIDEAAESVGVRPLIQLVGIWYAKDIISKEFIRLKNLDDYFLHSQQISLGCRIISEVTGVKEHDCEVSFVAGLIHDMGRLAIMLASNKLTTPLMGTQWDMMESIVNDERDLLGMDHCQIGMQLCKKWNFSPLMQQAVLRHHSPLVDNDFNYLGALIFTAHFVTCSDFTGQMLTKILPADVLDRLRLTETGFNKARKQYFTNNTGKQSNHKTSI